MILERGLYGIRCDGCGCELEIEDFTVFDDDEEAIKDTAKDCGWIEVRGKHYCDDCYCYGDDNELILGDGTVINEDEEDWL